MGEKTHIFAPRRVQACLDEPTIDAADGYLSEAIGLHRAIAQCPEHPLCFFGEAYGFFPLR